MRNRLHCLTCPGDLKILAFTLIIKMLLHHMIITKTATCRPVDYIINCSMDKFTELLAFEGLSEEQATYCKDIRRRGKNKVRYFFHFFELITFW